ERDLLDIRRGKESAIIGMEDVRLIQPVRHADARTELSLIVEALNLVIPHTKVEGPVVQGPLILDPYLLAFLDVGVGSGLGEYRSDRKSGRRVRSEVKQLELILRVRILELNPRLDEMALVRDPGVIEPCSDRVGLPRLIGRLLFRHIGQGIEGVGGE